MQDVKDREYDRGDGLADDESRAGDYSVMSVSSCCFSEDVLQEHSLMRAN